METERYTSCPNCFSTYRIPKSDEVLKITCKKCDAVFHASPPKNEIKSDKQSGYLIPSLIILGLIAFFLFSPGNKSDQSTSSSPSFFSKAKRSNWVSIDYGGLVDNSTITHSGETVGQVIRKIPTYTDDLKGQVQQYLEPFSILCHDVLLTTVEPDTLPLINILSHYPVGSEQPAWVDLFREGHYQLYYNNYLIRVFIKGSNVTSSFNKHQSVIRHPINDVINSRNASINTIEIYTFKNDYAKTEINLNTTPKVFDANNIDLSSKKKSIDLTSIEEFLSQGVILEAVEVDENNDLYFYGTNSSTQTMAGAPVSLSDIAVIYRSIFHYGNNAPYISLDTHEDNRYAKVNFGGHFENTRAGDVVLEADKLFKLLGTGLDPNTHYSVKNKITNAVPDFLTEDERSLIEGGNEGHTQIRYWFYPDSIGTVTDGSIGAVLTHQFLADIERMDAKVSPSPAIKKTIAHLNNNYSQYENAEITFKELSTVARIMALVNWLKGMNIDKKIELDELLSVKIPAFITPDRTQKLLTITTAAYPSNKNSYHGYNNSVLNAQNVREYSKTFNLSDLLFNYSSTTTDKKFLKVGSDYFSNMDMDELAPYNYKKLKNELESVEKRIEKKERTLNKYSSREINEFNRLVKKQNRLVKSVNDMTIQYRCITSVGGGINLRPNEFKRMSHNKNSPKLRAIKKIKNNFKEVNRISKSRNWLRNNPKLKGAKVNKIPVYNWVSTKTGLNEIKYDYSSSSGDNMSVSIQDIGHWATEIYFNDMIDKVVYMKDLNRIQISHSEIGLDCNGRVTSNGKEFSFQNRD